MKKKNFSEFFVLINVNNFDVRITKTAKRASEIAKCSRNTLKTHQSNTINEWIVRSIKEE